MSTTTKDTSIVLYGHRLSQPCRAIELLCLNNRIPYRLEIVDFINGACKEESFTSLNPQQQIPVVVFSNNDKKSEQSSFVLTESHAIMRYLCRTTDKMLSENWYPEKSSAKLCAQIDKWLDWHHVNVRSVAVPMVHAFVEVHNVPGMLKREVVEFRIRPWNETFKKAVRVLDQHLSTCCSNTNDDDDVVMLVGTSATIADLSLGCEFYQLHLLGYDFSQYKNILRWLKSLERNIEHWVELHQEARDFGVEFQEKNGKYLPGIITPSLHHAKL